MWRWHIFLKCILKFILILWESQGIETLHSSNFIMSTNYSKQNKTHKSSLEESTNLNIVTQTRTWMETEWVLPVKSACGGEAGKKNKT